MAMVRLGPIQTLLASVWIKLSGSKITEKMSVISLENILVKPVYYCTEAFLWQDD